MKLAPPPTLEELEREFSHPDGDADEAKSRGDDSDDSLVKTLIASGLFDDSPEKDDVHERDFSFCPSPEEDFEIVDDHDNDRGNSGTNDASIKWLPEHIRILQAKYQAQSMEIDLMGKQLRDFEKSLEDVCRADSYAELQSGVDALRERAASSLSTFCCRSSLSDPTTGGQTATNASAQKLLRGEREEFEQKLMLKQMEVESLQENNNQLALQLSTTEGMFNAKTYAQEKRIQELEEHLLKLPAGELEAKIESRYQEPLMQERAELESLQEHNIQLEQQLSASDGSFNPEREQMEPSSMRHTEKQLKQQVRSEISSPGEVVLPPGGQYVTSTTRQRLGVMFYKPQELRTSLFARTDASVLAALQERPVVAHLIQGSAAQAACVGLGHVLLSVNDVSVSSPAVAKMILREGPRPVLLRFFVPNTPIVYAQGDFMVQYHSLNFRAPTFACSWKHKYVVVGGIGLRPWMMHMYRSQSERDIAIFQAQSRQAVTVKVKQFSLQGASMLHNGETQWVRYSNEPTQRPFFVVVPWQGNPIKISAPSLSQLEPIRDEISRILETQG